MENDHDSKEKLHYPMVEIKHKKFNAIRQETKHMISIGFLISENPHEYCLTTTIQQGVAAKNGDAMAEISKKDVESFRYLGVEKKF